MLSQVLGALRPRHQRSLVACDEIVGGDTILKTPLVVHQERNVLLIPIGQPHKPGVYDHNGQIVRAAAYFRGLPEAHFPLEDVATDLPHDSVPYAPDGPTYVFAGHLTGHYGHFLFSMLGRLWSLPRPVPPSFKLVLLNGISYADLFDLDFARAMFEALGITPQHFADFREPVRFKELLVPDPSIEENHAGHPAFAELCHFIGKSVLSDQRASVSKARAGQRPVFLTKRKLSSGVHSISNEDEFCAVLEQKGVEIISPEQLSFRDQLAIWDSRSMIMGMSGSMLHTSIFVPGRKYTALNPEAWINSNQSILDRLNGNRSSTLYPRNGYIRKDAAEGFGNVLELAQPESTAHDFMEEAKRFYSRRA